MKLEWDFYDRVVAMADAAGPSSEEEFGARFPQVFPKGMQFLTAAEFEFDSARRWLTLTLTMAARRTLTGRTATWVDAQTYQAMAEEVAVASADASLRLLFDDPWRTAEVRVRAADEPDGAKPLAALTLHRPQMGKQPHEGLSRFECLRGTANPLPVRKLAEWAAAGRRERPDDAHPEAPVATGDGDLADVTPEAFELLVKELLEATGLSAEVTEYSKDGGVDIVAEDHRPFRRGRVVVQAKRYAGSVGVTTVRELNGVLPLHRAQRGIVVTTGRFTQDAIATARALGIELVDGVELRQALAEMLPR